MTELAALTTVEAAGLDDPIIVVPIGSTEQHGPHLPVATDTLVAQALAERLATARADVVVAPALPFGASGEHAGFAGTLSIGTEVLAAVIVELARSLAPTSTRLLILNGHGGNLDAVARAVAIARSESRDVRAWWPRIEGGDLHAGRTETAIMLSLLPESVRMDLAAPGDQRSLPQLLPLLKKDGVAGVSDNGVLGDPTGATSDEGDALVAAVLADLLASVEKWWP